MTGEGHMVLAAMTAFHIHPELARRQSSSNKVLTKNKAVIFATDPAEEAYYDKYLPYSKLCLCLIMYPPSIPC
jgi:hypothetical protein